MLPHAKAVYNFRPRCQEHTGPCLLLALWGWPGCGRHRAGHLSAGGLAVTGLRLGVPTDPAPLPSSPARCDQLSLLTGTEHSFISRVQVSAASACPPRCRSLWLPLHSPRPSLLAATASGPCPRPPRLPRPHLRSSSSLRNARLPKASQLDPDAGPSSVPIWL